MAALVKVVVEMCRTLYNSYMDFVENPMKVPKDNTFGKSLKTNLM